MGEYLLAIDAGTGSVRSCLFDLNGNQTGIAQREWVHTEDARYPGSMDFDCAKNWNLTKQTIAEVINKTGIDAADIIAIATTSMREGVVLYDGHNNEIFACANVDARASAEGPLLKKQIPGIEEDIYGISGQTFSLGSIVRLLWVKNNMPEVYEKTAKMNMLNDWITFKLTGEIVSEPSNGCTTGIFDLKKRRWDNGILIKCGLKGGILPDVTECGSVVGNISNECARETGLSVKTAVVQGGGDAQLGTVGIGVTKNGGSAIFGGSFWQFEHNTDKLIFDSKCRIRINCQAIPNMWQYEAIAFYPGLVMKWYKNAFCGGGDAYAEMEAGALKVPPGSHGTQCAFSDVMDYINWRHAAPTFTNFGIDADKFNRYTFYRAIMENAAYVCRGHLDLIREVTGASPQSVTFAGGASNSKLWRQILADVLNIPVRVPVIKEATSLGAAILAGAGAGVYENVDTACAKLVKTEEEYQPNNSNVGVYNELYDKWRGVYKAQLALADNNVTEHMWKAPGV